MNVKAGFANRGSGQNRGLSAFINILKYRLGKGKSPACCGTGVSSGWCVVLKCGIGKLLGSCPYLGRAEWIYIFVYKKNQLKMQNAVFRPLFGQCLHGQMGRRNQNAARGILLM